jgi:hypothetical protein
MSKPFLEEIQRIEAKLSIIAVGTEEISLAVHPAIGDDRRAFEPFIGEEIHVAIHGSASSAGP